MESAPTPGQVDAPSAASGCGEVTPTATSSRRFSVHGDSHLHHYRSRLEEAQATHTVQELLTQVGIWLPLDVYFRWPVMLPFAVRDLACRPTGHPEGKNEWGAPDAMGYFRDDNSLIKGLVRSLEISAPQSRGLSGARTSGGFVAAHIWRVVKDSDLLATRISGLNSFVPNLVWLPREIAKLSDIEGGEVQRTLQAMSLAIYRSSPVAPQLQQIVDECWHQLPIPEAEIDDVDKQNLNWFVSTPKFLAVRSMRVRQVASALDRLEQFVPLTQKVVSSRYTAGLPMVAPENRLRLRKSLEPFLEAPLLPQTHS